MVTASELNVAESLLICLVIPLAIGLLVLILGLVILILFFLHGSSLLGWLLLFLLVLAFCTS